MSSQGNLEIPASGVVRYERRKQDHPSPVPHDIGVVIAQGNASGHEGSREERTAAPCDCREEYPPGATPAAPYTLGVGPQPRQILETCPA